ncbi:hypothetical protein F4778DRAFT_744205 [Xylariomycetidae sp. FL2044]|nr:hypothetical protein F4778DRAFT_744205 [Xylariomycetidae sp. FL2044]
MSLHWVTCISRCLLVEICYLTEMESLILYLFISTLVHTACGIPDGSIAAPRTVETVKPSINPKGDVFDSKPLNLRAVTMQVSTCGYRNGNPALSRTANPGFHCLVDITRGLWGFCPTTVISASDCGLWAACVDSYACSTGCGQMGTTGLTTWSCTRDNALFCSTALLDSGFGQTFSYIACGATAKTDTLFVSPTELLTTSISIMDHSSSSLSSSTSEVVSAGSTTASDAAATASTAAQPDIPAAAAEQSQEKNSGTHVGVIIGGVLGGLALICGTVLGIVYLLRRRRHANQAETNKTSPGQEAKGLDSGMVPEHASRMYTESTLRQQPPPPPPAQGPAAEMYAEPPVWQQQRGVSELEDGQRR